MRYLVPDWPAPLSVHAYSTTRDGGVSSGPFAKLNLAEHVGDDSAVVGFNRQNFQRTIGLNTEAHWLNQVHGAAVKVLKQDFDVPVMADAAVSRIKNQACAIMTADCLPILLCDKSGTVVGASHAGWRGLAAGVVEATVAAMSCQPDTIMAWLGPAISQKHFEVGPEVYEAFGHGFDSAFKPSVRHNHFMADIYQIARIKLNALGVNDIYGGQFCTYSDARFYSYRRDQGKTGRMASLIWLG
jgi:YfiH family protein